MHKNHAGAIIPQATTNHGTGTKRIFHHVSDLLPADFIAAHSDRLVGSYPFPCSSYVGGKEDFHIQLTTANNTIFYSKIQFDLRKTDKSEPGCITA